MVGLKAHDSVEPSSSMQIVDIGDHERSVLTSKGEPFRPPPVKLDDLHVKIGNLDNNVKD